MRWHQQLDTWKQFHLTQKLDVRVHGSDNVNDFLMLLGSSSVEQVRINEGLNPLILKLYNAVPALRGTHDSHIDAFLSELIPGNGERPPWAVSPALAEKVITDCLDDNRRLMTLLDEGQRSMAERDDRWWFATRYMDRKTMSADDLRLSAEEAVLILRTVLPGLKSKIPV